MLPIFFRSSQEQRHAIERNYLLVRITDSELLRQQTAKGKASYNHIIVAGVCNDLRLSKRISLNSSDL